jgi:serine/threonine protein kinase
MSPEMVAKVPHQAASSDIWAAGILFYTLIFGEHPFKGASEKELFRKIQVGEYKCPEHVRLSCGAQRLIRGCLEKSMERRWDAARILSDEWMAES